MAAVKIVDPETRTDERLRSDALERREAIKRGFVLENEHIAAITRCDEEQPELARVAAEADREVERAIAECAPFEQALAKAHAHVAELRARAADCHANVLRNRDEKRSHAKALDEYHVDAHGVLLPADLERALSRIRRDDDSPTLLLTDDGRIGVTGDAAALTALVLHESRLPASELREYRERLADGLR